MSAIPHDPEVEASILAWLIREPERFYSRAIGEGIGPDHFFAFREAAEIIFDRIRTGKTTADLVTFAAEETATGRLERMGGRSGLLDIYGAARGGGGYWENHVGILRDRYALRLARESLAEIGEAIDGTDARDRLSDALETIDAAVKGPQRAVTAKEAGAEWLDHWRGLIERGELPGLPTGFLELDGISGGMRPGELWVVAGRPSRGKSVLLLQVAGAVIEAGGTAALFSCEMMKRECIGRLLSCIGRVSHDIITKPGTTITNEVKGKIDRALRQIAESNLFIDDRADLGLEMIVAESKRIRDTTGRLDLVAVDYLQLVGGDRRRNESRQEEVARISGGMKQLAKALNCPVMTASQLNDDGKVRESRAIEQDADALLGITDDGIKVVKLRHGRRNDLLPLALNGEFQRFDTRS